MDGITIGRERFVVIAAQGLGDSLQATPMLEALRAAAPDAEIEVVVLRKPAQMLFAGLPQLVDRVRYLPFWEKGARAFVAEAARIPLARTADATFLTFPSARKQYAVLQALFRARAHYSHDYPEARQINRFVPGMHLIPISDQPNVVRNGGLLRRAGIDDGAPLYYTVPAAWRGSGARDRNSIVLHVGSIAHDDFDRKRWPETSFATLARRLIARGFDVKALAGPDEREVTARVRDAAPGLALLEGDLASVARTVSQSGLVVANDNGIAHLAAGVRTPVVALFGPTPVNHAPFSPSAVALRPSPCPACFSPLRVGMDCVRNIDYRCLKQDLTVDIAEAAVLEALSATQV